MNKKQDIIAHIEAYEQEQLFSFFVAKQMGLVSNKFISEILQLETLKENK